MRIITKNEKSKRIFQKTTNNDTMRLKKTVCQNCYENITKLLQIYWLFFQNVIFLTQRLASYFYFSKMPILWHERKAKMYAL